MATGAFVMCRALIAGEVLRALISMMVLMDGINLMTGAVAMKADRIRGRRTLLAVGAAELLLGAAGFLRQDILGGFAAFITGVSLLYEGLAIALTWHMGMKWMRREEKAEA